MYLNCTATYDDADLVAKLASIKNKIIEFENIGTPCILFHSKYKNDICWDSYKASDFRVLKQLLNL